MANINHGNTTTKNTEFAHPLISIDISSNRNNGTTVSDEQMMPTASIPSKGYSPHNSNDTLFATAVCFLSATEETREVRRNDETTDSDDDEDIGDIQFVCDRLPTEGITSLELEQDEGNPILLATCDSQGSCWLWDVGRRTIVRSLTTSTHHSAAAALSLRRVSDQCFLLHRRDGTVGLYDVETGQLCSSSTLYTTESPATFCAAVPCKGNHHLIAMPQGQESVVVRDWRQTTPVHRWKLPATGECGMVMSLAAVSSSTTSSHLTVACGMENGQLLVCSNGGHGSCTPSSSLELGKEPIMGLDMVMGASGESADHNFDIVAGMAGNTTDLAATERAQQGRVVLVETTELESKIQARISTTASDNNKNDSYYKSSRAGVAVCRFIPNDLFAVGGWDHRLRLYHRSTCRPVMVLRGHADSITAMDYQPRNDNATRCNRILLATAGMDGTVLLWSVS